MNEGRVTTSPLQARVLAMLLLAYIFNFLDRQILGILAAPIKPDLKSHRRPVRRDRRARLRAYSIRCWACRWPCSPTAPAAAGSSPRALAVWSAFTALCGTATGYWQMFLFRLGVGVGEAGGVAPSMR